MAMLRMVSSIFGERKTTQANRLDKVISGLGKVGIVSSWCNTVGVSVLFLTVILTFADVLLRYLFNSPIRGAFETTGLMMIVAVFLGIAYSQKEKGHVGVDAITQRLSTTGQLTMGVITTLIGIGVFTIVTWQAVVLTLSFWERGAIHSPNAPFPIAPFAGIIAFGSALLLLALVLDFLVDLFEALKRSLKAHLWLLMFGIPVALGVFAVFWMRPTLWQIEPVTIGVIGVVCSLLFLLTGMPIAFALILTGFLFIGHLQGSAAALDIIGSQLYRVTSNYIWAVIAFFVLMGCLCLFNRFGEDLYYAAHKWLGRISGGLAMATVAACTAFSAIVGDPISVTAAMGATALPEMRRYKYDDYLTSGVIAAGSTLGPMIPPSLTFIIYAILTEQSIGKLFIAGIIPGLLLAISFMGIVYLRCRLNPSLGPRGPVTTWGEKMSTFKAGGPIVILFVLVIGGIYGGIFTPLEGGGIGAVGAVIIGLIMRRLTWRTFNLALLSAGKIIAMVFLLLIGAMIFTRFVAFCNLPDVVTQFMTSLALPHIVIVLIILLIFFILGFIMDTNPLVLIFVPILHPVAMAMGYDPIWFTVLVVLIINVGMITPPVGISLFALKGVAKEIPIATIYRGVMPFVLATLVVVAIIIIVPGAATALPNLIK